MMGNQIDIGGVLAKLPLFQQLCESEIINLAAETREEQKQFLAASLQVIRECMLVNVSEGPLVRLEETQRAALQKFIPFINLNNVDLFSEALSEAAYHDDEINGKDKAEEVRGNAGRFARAVSAR